MIPNFIVWYKLSDGQFRTYNYQLQKYKTQSCLTREMNEFEFITKNKEELTDEGLQTYADDLVDSRNELLTSKALKVPFDYFDNSFKCSGRIFYRSHSNNVKTFIKKFLKKEHLEFEPITVQEEDYFRKTYRGGQTYGLPGEYDCITYDFKFFYPGIMASQEFYIPRTEGKVTEIKQEIPKKRFKYGIYNIKITSTDVNFNKLFSFSKDNHYTHISLNFTLEYISQTSTQNIKMEFLSNKALLYDDLISGSDIFYVWHSVLCKLKKEFPNNKLVKKLGSSCWGELQNLKNIWKTEEEIINEELDVGFGYENEYHIEEIRNKSDGDIYRLIHLQGNLYEYQFRLKAFLTDFGRVKIAKIAMDNIENVVRIQTDSITFDTNPMLSIYNFQIDDKKTGRFEVLNRKVMRRIE